MKTLKVILIGVGSLVLVLVAAIALVLTPPLFPEEALVEFRSRDGAFRVVLQNIERVRFGDETYIWLRAQEGDYRSEKFMVDVNGRLGYEKSYRVDLSPDRRWIRTCRELGRPQSGVLVWRPDDSKYAARNERWARGKWVVEKPGPGQVPVEYAIACDTYIDHRAGRMIKKVYPNSTREQRESLLFAPKEAGDASDMIEGEAVLWEPMKRLAPPAEAAR